MCFTKWGRIFLVVAGSHGCPLSAETPIDGTWSEGPVTLAVDFRGAPSGSDDAALLRQAVVLAAARWNAVIGRPFFRIVDAPAGGAPGSANGIDEVYFSPTLASYYGAVDIKRDGVLRRVESDIVLNPAYQWFDYRGPLRHDENGLRVPDLYRVTLHEMGHILGLGHAKPETSLSVMRSRMSDVDDLAAEDVRDVKAAVALLFQQNKPRITEPRRFRSSTPRRSVVLRGIGRPFFTPTMTLKIESAAGSRRRHVRIAETWRVRIRLGEGSNRVRFYYRMPDHSTVQFVTKVIRVR